MSNKSQFLHDRNDLAAYWSVPLLDGVHTVEFEHGTTTGKRVLILDGKEVFRKDWMFKLVGDIKFTLGQQEAQCELRVDPIPTFAFSYTLLVDGKPYEKFAEKQRLSMKCWSVMENAKRYAVVLAKNTLEIWVNGQVVDVDREFVEGGTEMTFKIDNLDAKVVSSTETDGKKDISYRLFVNDQLVMNETNNNT